MGKRLLTGAACVGITTTMFASTIFASPIGKTELNVIGVAAAVSSNKTKTPEKSKAKSTVAPLAAAAVVSQATEPTVAPLAAAAVTPVSNTAETEHAAVEALEAREAAEANSPYKDIAISQVENYVNIRQEPNTDAEVLGKIYNNAAATILETVDQEDGTWYKIKSGSVEGYICLLYTSDVYKRQAEKGPMLVCVKDNQAGHAGGRGGCKQRVRKRRDFSAF